MEAVAMMLSGLETHTCAGDIFTPVPDSNGCGSTGNATWPARRAYGTASVLGTTRIHTTRVAFVAAAAAAASCQRPPAAAAPSRAVCAAKAASGWQPAAAPAAWQRQRGAAGTSHWHICQNNIHQYICGIPGAT